MRAKKGGVWDSENLPAANPTFPNLSAFVFLKTKESPKIIGCYDYEQKCFINRNHKKVEKVTSWKPIL